jgi:ribonuclease HI
MPTAAVSLANFARPDNNLAEGVAAVLAISAPDERKLGIHVEVRTDSKMLVDSYARWETERNERWKLCHPLASVFCVLDVIRQRRRSVLSMHHVKAHFRAEDQFDRVLNSIADHAAKEVASGLSQRWRTAPAVDLKPFEPYVSVLTTDAHPAGGGLHVAGNLSAHIKAESLMRSDARAANYPTHSQAGLARNVGVGRLRAAVKSAIGSGLSQDGQQMLVRLISGTVPTIDTVIQWYELQPTDDDETDDAEDELESDEADEVQVDQDELPVSPTLRTSSLHLLHLEGPNSDSEEEMTDQSESEVEGLKDHEDYSTDDTSLAWEVEGEDREDHVASPSNSTDDTSLGRELEGEDHVASPSTGAVTPIITTSLESDCVSTKLNALRKKAIYRHLRGVVVKDGRLTNECPLCDRGDADSQRHWIDYCSASSPVWRVTWILNVATMVHALIGVRESVSWWLARELWTKVTSVVVDEEGEETHQHWAHRCGLFPVKILTTLLDEAEGDNAKVFEKVKLKNLVRTLRKAMIETTASVWRDRFETLSNR